jgi:hypothetical protein
MAVREIAHDSWRAALDSFSRQHEGSIVSITTRDPRGAVAVAAHDVPIIHGNDGSATTIAFRSPMRPEEADGVSVRDRR